MAAKAIIFISCGQFTEKEKSLGKQIASMVKAAGFDPFFAEDVQDLNGLDANILSALHDCAGFITVLHPRGNIKRPDGPELTRASVWIEQEIAIATYIQRTEKRALPIIAFKHVSVGREGIRDLLHLNPIEFTDEFEIMSSLPERLMAWKHLKLSGIRVELKSIPHTPQDGHPIRTLQVLVVNDSSQRFSTYNVEVRVPAGILKHWSCVYSGEIPSKEPHRRCFRFSEVGRGPLNPCDKAMFSTEYCTKCAADDREHPAFVANAIVEANAWIDGQEYTESKTIQQLALER